MPPTAKPSADVMLLIGQLLEAAKAASEGLKTTNTEIQANGKALIAAVKTLELIEETVSELDRLVRTGNGDSVLTRLTVLRLELTELQKLVCELEDRTQVVVTQVTDLNRDRANVLSHKNVLWGLGKVLAWIVTTAIAVAALLKGTS